MKTLLMMMTMTGATAPLKHTSLLLGSDLSRICWLVMRMMEMMGMMMKMMTMMRRRNMKMISMSRSMRMGMKMMRMSIRIWMMMMKMMRWIGTQDMLRTTRHDKTYPGTTEVKEMLKARVNPCPGFDLSTRTRSCM